MAGVFTAAGIALAAAVAAVLGIGPVRRALVSAPLLRAARPRLPHLGETERVALEAGTVWWDREIFSGTPRWRDLLDFRPRPLDSRERAFLDGPVEELCRLLDDWRIHQDRELPPEIWELLKRERFFGMIIPEQYGGHGFSALAHSQVILKIASRSVPAACVVMVPNSLGPAELLLHYGTDEQRRHYLPRLARGDEIPCFALTEPEAGSDAASPRATGVVCRGTVDGHEVLGLRLDWDKRYITLAPVATLIGLAFRALDPEGLVGTEPDLGITCALVPRDLPGIAIGDHHDPMGVPFPNGPTTGRGVFVPLDRVIGGRAGLGQGWRMLMDCLAAGRSISLPALSVAAAELATRTVGAYATIREQFDRPIGRFEGVQERLARIGGMTYLMNAARLLTCGAVDAGEKPAVLSAIVKAYLTEAMRGVVGDALDVQAGAAICRGPRNVLGRVWAAAPIAITVEGSNILTRSMIIFGQGAIRCHPFLRDEAEAAAAGDVRRFDRALFGHLGHVLRNAARAFVLGLGGGRLGRAPVGGAPGLDPGTAAAFRALDRWSAAFALVSDGALAVLGGALKRHEAISGRLADALAWIYLSSAALKRFHDDGAPAADLPLVRWGVAHAACRIQEALQGVLDNLPSGAVRLVLRPLVFPLGATARPPPDSLGFEIARGLCDGGELRRRLTADMFVPAGNDGLGRLETALAAVLAARSAAGKCGAADAAAARLDAIQVDAFDPATYRALKG